MQRSFNKILGHTKLGAYIDWEPVDKYMYWEFPSKSTPGKEYTVQWKKYAGIWILSCNCPIWIFNRRGNRTCSHTDNVYEELRAKGEEPPTYPPPIGAASIFLGQQEWQSDVKYHTGQIGMLLSDLEKGSDRTFEVKQHCDKISQILSIRS